MKSERRYLQRELAQHLKAQDRAKLRELRAKIDTAKVTRRAALASARQQCRSARLDLRDRQKLERVALRDMQRSMRRKGRTACDTGKGAARELGRLEESAAQAKLREERRLQEEIRAADKRGGGRMRSSARERREEDDDAVRANLPPELVPVFDQLKKKIKGGPRRTRTEAFLEWAEENPGEIVAVQQAEADAYLAKLLAEEKEHAKAMRKAGRYRSDATALRKALAGVPF